MVQQELETFLASTAARERPVPRFVARELRAFLRCGILAHGFVRMHCDGCGQGRVVAFSCKGRGFCPSCGGRRMADTAAHLADRMLPEVPVRQWVLSLPFALRYRLAYDAPLVRDVLAIFVQSVLTSLRRRARKQWAIARGHSCLCVSENDLRSRFARPHSPTALSRGPGGPRRRSRFKKRLAGDRDRTRLDALRPRAGACLHARARAPTRPASRRSQC